MDNVTKDRVIERFNVGFACNAISLSPDGRLIAVGGREGKPFCCCQSFRLPYLPICLLPNLSVGSLRPRNTPTTCPFAMECVFAVRIVAYDKDMDEDDPPPPRVGLVHPLQGLSQQQGRE